MAWVWARPDGATVRRIAATLGLQPLTASILVQRGFSDPEAVRRCVSPVLGHLEDSSGLPDIVPAVARIGEAIRRREPVLLYGDYDVDGTSATAIYALFLRGLGVPVSCYIPHRVREGYGLNHAALTAAREAGARLVITSDCGTGSTEVLAEARKRGVDVIVTDHHRCPDVLPEATALINPHRTDARYRFRDLCSAALAWKVTSAVGESLGMDGDGPAGLLDLAALGTIGDVMPLVGENRAIVGLGLAALSEGSRVGIRALKRASGLPPAGRVSVDTVGYQLAPRLNAAGRMAEGIEAVRLLTATDPGEAAALAERLCELNRRRQRLEERLLGEAVRQAEPQAGRGGIVVASGEWHPGVIGILAARLVDRFGKPAIVIAVDPEGVGRGSARTLPGFDLYRGLVACADLLTTFGGHAGAAGLTVRAERIDALRERFVALCREAFERGVIERTLTIDGEATLKEVTFPLVREFDSLAPFGPAFPEPVIVLRAARATRVRVVGKRHLRLTVRQDSVPEAGSRFTGDAIGFGWGETADRIAAMGEFDLAVTPKIERREGEERIMFHLVDLRPAQE